MSDSDVRIARMREELEIRHLDAMVIWQAQNRRYLSGFTGSTGMIVLTADEARMVTDSRYFEQVLRQCPEYQLDRVEGQTFDALANSIAETKSTVVGIEADTVTVSESERLEALLPDIKWVSTTGIVETLRAVKSPDEIQRLMAAIALTDEAMAHAFEVAHPGMTEGDLAWQLEAFMRENGAEAMAFDIIVAAGENGALPHHQPSDRPIRKGEPVVIDMGAQLDGFCGDLTRTFALGPVDESEYAAVYEIVRQANQAATDEIRVGMTGPEVDAIARKVIADAEYGDYFGHGLGHGVGLYIHELPRLGATAGDEPLKANMVMTIEPGIYLPGRFGVRVEDVIVLKEDGAQVLSNTIKEPIIEV